MVNKLKGQVWQEIECKELNFKRFKIKRLKLSVLKIHQSLNFSHSR